VRRVDVDASGCVSGVEYLPWTKPIGLDPRTPPPSQTAQGTVYVLAAHAIENAKLLLNSKTASLPNGVANSSDQVGRNLMDHVQYLSWALAPEGQPVFPFRGPLATPAIARPSESLDRRIRQLSDHRHAESDADDRGAGVQNVPKYSFRTRRVMR
jgi:hypothetical protein